MEEIKVTWRLAWAFWWRWLLMSLAFAVIVYVPLVLLVLGAWNY